MAHSYVSLFAAVTAVLVAGAVARPVSAATGSHGDDVVLKAMQTELDREKAELLLPGMQRPYFIEYRLDDFATFEAVANYGALARQEEGHQRVVRVVVRIGDYKTDSSSSRGEGAVQLAPTDNNAQAIRYSLWTATDDAYKNALRAYSAKQAALKRFESAPEQEDFAEAKAATYVGPTGRARSGPQGMGSKDRRGQRVVRIGP